MELFNVKDKLPEKFGSYLVFAPLSFPKNSRFMIAEFYDDNNTFYSESGGEHALPDVTHWAYLPAEPTASNNGFNLTPPVDGAS